MVLHDTNMQQIQASIMPAKTSKKQGWLNRCFCFSPESPTTKFVGAGCLLLLMLAVVPVWNAATLLQNFNYLFWSSPRIPQYIIIVATCMVPLYGLVGIVFFTSASRAVITEQTIMTIATTFITLFGLALMILSIFLTRQSEITSNNLLFDCNYSPETHRLYEFSTVLQNIRATPDCALKYSVEDCAGYQDAPPYTDFLKEMETEFKCAGFCYNAKLASQSSSKAALIGTEAHQRSVHKDHITSLLSQSAGNAVKASSAYPPTLFSDVNWQASCESMAARDMKNFAGDIGSQTFFQGAYLVAISVATGFLKLLGLCLRRSEPKEARFSDP